MIRALHPFLIAVLMLTSVALGTARGQVMADGQVVLCSGARVTMGADGQPGGPVHVCPDMALSLLAALATPDLPEAPLRRATPADPVTLALRATPHPAPKATARGPPVLVV